MSYIDLNIKPNIGQEVFTFSSSFKIGQNKSSYSIIPVIVQEIEDDGIWTNKEFIYYEYLFPTKSDVKSFIKRNNQSK